VLGIFVHERLERRVRFIEFFLGLLGVCQ
jgi:hypothetical protein